MTFKIELGKKVKDSITGFNGIVTGKVEYITGCRQYLVVGKSKDNKPADSLWFDEDRLLGNPIGKKAENNGGPQLFEPHK